MNGSLGSALLAAVVALSSPAPQGDKVELLTGEVFFGHILRDNRHEVSIQLQSGGIISFRKSRVKRISTMYKESDAVRNGKGRQAEDKGSQSVDDAILDNGKNSAWKIEQEMAKISEPEKSAPIIFALDKLIKKALKPKTTPVVSPPATTPPPEINTEDSVFRRVLHQDPSFAWKIPSRLVEQAATKTDGCLLRYVDPSTKAEGEVRIESTRDPLIEVKKRIIRSQANNLSHFSVVQDAEFTRLPSEAWLVEVKATDQDRQYRHLQMFVRQQTGVLVFSLRIAEEEWSEREALFRTCIESIQIQSPEAKDKKE